MWQIISIILIGLHPGNLVQCGIFVLSMGIISRTSAIYFFCGRIAALGLTGLLLGLSQRFIHIPFMWLHLVFGAAVLGFGLHALVKALRGPLPMAGKSCGHKKGGAGRHYNKNMGFSLGFMRGFTPGPNKMVIWPLAMSAPNAGVSTGLLLLFGIVSSVYLIFFFISAQLVTKWLDKPAYKRIAVIFSSLLLMVMGLIIILKEIVIKHSIF